MTRQKTLTPLSQTRRLTAKPRIPCNRGNVAVRRWWRDADPNVIEQACKQAGITYKHFKSVAAARRVLSPAAAAVFIRASKGALTLENLVMSAANRRKAASR